MKKPEKSIFILFFSLFFIISCNNSVSPFSLLPQDDDSNHSVNADSLTWVTATGYFSVDSAFADQLSNDSRAAFPDTATPLASAYYYVTATAQKEDNTTLTSSGTVDSPTGYSIPLAAGYAWTITIEIKHPTNSSVVYMSGSTTNTVTPSADEPFTTVSDYVFNSINW